MMKGGGLAEISRFVHEIRLRFKMAEGQIAKMDLTGLPFVHGQPHRCAEQGVDFYISPLGEVGGMTWDFVTCKGYIAPHMHVKSSTEIFIIAGQGTFFLSGSPVVYDAKSHCSVPANASHGLFTRFSVFLSVQSPSIYDAETGRYDIVQDTDFKRPPWTFFSWA